MDINEKNHYSNIMLDFLKTATTEIEALEGYYNKSIEIANKLIEECKEEYNVGLQIDGKVQEINKSLQANSIEETKELIESIKKFELESGKQIEEYVDFNLNADDKGNKITYTFKVFDDDKANFYNPIEARREMSKYKKHERIVICSTLSDIIIIFERFLGGIYKGLILIDPIKYFEDKTIKITELFNKRTSDVLIGCVEREVASNLFESIDLFDMVCKKEKIQIDRLREIRDSFLEIYFRRNIFVHNAGRVNEIYLSKIPEVYKDGMVLGQELLSDTTYIINSINTLFNVLCTLYYEIQASKNPESTEWCDKLSILGFDLMLNGDFEKAKQIYLYLRKSSFLEFKEKAMYEINYILCLQQVGLDKEARKEIESLDLSIATNDFKIAKLCLEQNFKAVYESLSSDYPTSFDAKQIRDWPIFINFRESEHYMKFVKKHQDDFKMFVFDFNENQDEVS